MHLASPPVTSTLNIFIHASLGDLFSLHKTSYFILFCRFQHVTLLCQFTYFVIEFQCKMLFLLCMSRKLYLLKSLSSLTSLIVQIHQLIFSQPKYFLFPCSAPLRQQRELQRIAVLPFFFFFPPVTLSAHSDILGFFRFPIFCLLFILLPIWGSYGTTNSSEICFLSGLPEHINFSSSFGWTLIILRLYQLPIFWKV